MAQVILTEKPSMYQRGEQTVVLFPSKPYWFSATSEISDILGAFELGESKTICARITELLQIPPEEADSIYNDISQLLFSSGVLSIDGNVSEVQVIEPHFQVAEVENVLVIATTNLCNMACPMCYAMAGGKADNEMATSDIFAIVDQVRDMPWDNDNGITRIALTGGELFSRPDAIQLIEYVHSQGLAVQVNTNATLLTLEDIDRLAALPRLKLSISLDGSQPATHEFIRGAGNFKVTTETIRTLAAKGVFVAINMFVHAGNINELKSTLQLAVTGNLKEPNCGHLKMQ